MLRDIFKIKQTANKPIPVNMLFSDLTVYANIEDSTQPAHSCSLLKDFIARISMQRILSRLHGKVKIQLL